MQIEQQPDNPAAPAAQGRLAWLSPTLLASLFCFAFAAVTLVLIVGPADGTWQLYAQEMLQGKRLYSDLDFNQQPLFPLITLISLKLSAGGIISGRWLFFLILAGYVAVIARLCRMAAVGPLTSFVLMIAVFFVSIHFLALRFDDYHGLAGLLCYSSLLVSMALQRGNLSILRFGLLQAAICTAAALTRPNDGVAIAAAAAFVALLQFGIRRDVLIAALWSALLSSALILLTLLVLRETPQVWFQKSVIEASSAKGGEGSLFSYPLMIYRAAFTDVVWRFVLPAWLSIAPALVAGWAAMRLTKLGSRYALVATLAAWLFFALLIFKTNRHLVIEHVTPMIVLASALACIAPVWVLRWRPVGRGEGQSSGIDLALFAYPTMLFAFGSLSSGGDYLSLYQPCAMALILIVIFATRPGVQFWKQRLGQGLLLVLLTLIAVEGVEDRVQSPYLWLDYRVPPMTGEYLLRNDANGLHFIPKELAGMIDPVCAKLTPGKTLLSVPWSFANYYCHVDPWHGYVQTFFDTATAPRIAALRRDLDQFPPDFIFYQQQSLHMRSHEIIYHKGKPVAQRGLEEQIMRNVAAGKWRIVFQSRTYDPSIWYLIQTR
jgi:hypothetical protein